MNFTSPLWEITYHMGSHGVTCHPEEVTTFTQPKLVTQFSDHEGMQG